MPSPLDPIRREVAAVLAGGAYAPLRAAVVDAAASVDEDARLTEAERDWFDELYDAVYMGGEDPVSPADARAGIVGAAALRVQLRELQLDRFRAPPA